MQNSYEAIITESTKETFNSYIQCIDIPEIDYFAIGIQHISSKKSISLMSRSEWQDLFVKNNYAPFDPVRKAMLFSKRTIIPFSELDYCSSFGKEIMRQRTKEGIKDGIILIKKADEYNTILTLGTGYSSFDAYDFLKKHHDKIELIKNDICKIIQKDARTFIENTKKINRPSSDAK
jgi:hypothetical protein